MLQRKHRIKNESEIISIRTEGIRDGGRFYRFISRKTAYGRPLRFSIAVGVSQAKKAIVRNRLRRRTWGALERSMGNVNGYDILIMPSVKVKDALFQDLVKELTFLIHALTDRHPTDQPLAKNPVA